MQALSRHKAIGKGLTRYFTGRPCVRDHIAERMVSNMRCIACANLASNAWKKANVAKCSAQRNEWAAANREKVRELNRSYYQNDPKTRAGQAARSRKWLEANREKSRASSAKWRQTHLATAAAAQARRKAKKLQRTPSWADHEKIRQLYILAKTLTEQTGIEHEVDHIYPLQGKLVSGLHVETNLQVIPKSDNRAKGARLLGHT